MREEYLALIERGKELQSQLNDMANQIEYFINSVAENCKNLYEILSSDANETKEKEDLHGLLREELKEMGIPEHYKIYEILDHFITGIETGIIELIEDDAKNVPDEVYEYIAWGGRKAGYAKRAITMFYKKAMPAKKSRFGFDDPSYMYYSNDLLLYNMYKYITENM